MHTSATIPWYRHLTNWLRRGSPKMYGLLLGWLALVLLGMSSLVRYDRTPGASGPITLQWPVASRLHRDGSRPELLLFVHSRCPCSQASLDELTRILAACAGRLSARVLLFRPAGSAWTQDARWQRAGAIAGLRVEWDDGGVEALRFGALTSGDALLWSTGGTLLYRGGLTASRGQAGDNPAARAVVALVLAGQGSQVRAPVYGCPIAAPDMYPASAETRR